MLKSKRIFAPGINIIVLAAVVLVSAVFLLLDFGEPFAAIEVKFAFLLALLLIAAGGNIIYRHIKKTGMLFDGYNLVWLSFIFVYLVSAACHLLNTNSVLQGFYDMIESGSPVMVGRIYYSLLIVAVAFVALRVGLGADASEGLEHHEQLKVNYRLLLVLGIFFTVVSVISTVRLFGGIPSLRTILTVNRYMETGGGTARYVFISQWLCWGLIFLTIYFLHTPAARSRGIFLLWFSCAACAIVANIFWSGSRAGSVISLLPGLLLLQRLRPKYMKSVLVLIAVLFLSYFSLCTYLRSENFADYRLSEHLTAVLDWQMGRFSMVGLGVEMVDTEGLGKGLTLLDGFINVVNAPSTLLKLPALLPVVQSAPSVVGEYLVGDPEVRGVVPGSIFDFYYNFGLVGVAAGYFIIGKIIRKSNTIMRTTGSMGVFMVWSYVIVTLSVCCIAGTATSWVYYLVTTGFPALCFLGCEIFLSHNRLSAFSFAR